MLKSDLEGDFLLLGLVKRYPQLLFCSVDRNPQAIVQRVLDENKQLVNSFKYNPNEYVSYIDDEIGQNLDSLFNTHPVFRHAISPKCASSDMIDMLKLIVMKSLHFLDRYLHADATISVDIDEVPTEGLGDILILHGDIMRSYQNCPLLEFIFDHGCIERICVDFKVVYDRRFHIPMVGQTIEANQKPSWDGFINELRSEFSFKNILESLM